MSIIFRGLLILVTVANLFYMVQKTRKAQMKIEESVFWVGISAVFVFLSIFPMIASFLADSLGIGATVNFIFLTIIFIVLEKLFIVSIKLSKLESRYEELVQEYALDKKRMEDKTK